MIIQGQIDNDGYSPIYRQIGFEETYAYVGGSGTGWEITHIVLDLDEENNL